MIQHLTIISLGLGCLIWSHIIGAWAMTILVIMPCFWNAVGIRHIFFQCRQHTACSWHSRKHWNTTIKGQVFRIAYWQKIVKTMGWKIMLMKFVYLSIYHTSYSPNFKGSFIFWGAKRWSLTSGTSVNYVLFII